MKRWMIAATALALCASGAANAADSSSAKSWNERAAGAFGGDVSLYAGWGSETWSANVKNPITSHSLVGGLARTNVFLDPKWSMQLDFAAQNLNSSAGDFPGWDFAGHFSARSASHLLGVFASIGQPSSAGYGRDMEATVGIEGLMFLGAVHLYGQAGWTRTIDALSTWGNSTPYVHGEIRYFPQPNLMLAANVGFAQASEREYHADFIRWGGDLEFRCDNTPWSGFVSYQGSSEKWDGDNTSHRVHSVLVGVRMHFGNGSTLEAASRSGATLRDLNVWTGTNAAKNVY